MFWGTGIFHFFSRIRYCKGHRWDIQTISVLYWCLSIETTIMRCRSSFSFWYKSNVYYIRGLYIQHTRVGNRYDRSTLIIKMHQLWEYISVQHRGEMQQKHIIQASLASLQHRTTINTVNVFITQVSNTSERSCQFFLSFLNFLLSAEGKNLTECYESFHKCITG